MAADGYLRFPHLSGESLVFVAEDDVWLAPLAGGRAWRVTADRVRVGWPRLSPDGSTLAWTSWRDGRPEVHLAPVDGGPGRRVTYWSDPMTRVRGWTPQGRVLAVSATGRPFAHHTWAYAVPADGGPAEELAYGPLGDAFVGADGTAVLLTGVTGRDPAYWKRYRGGAGGRLWVDDGAGEPRRILPDLAGSLACPMLVGGRIAFLSDHEGVGNLYSCRADGSDLRRHTDHADFYARNAGTDGGRVVYQCAAELWLLDDLDSVARRLTVRLGGTGAGRRPRQVRGSGRVADLSCDHTGRASAMEIAGTVHWVTHREGPARALAADPGVRARSPRVLGDTGDVVWVVTVDGADALEIASVAGSEPGTTPRRLAAGLLGWVEDLCAAPDGSTVAVAAHDGRLLVVDVPTGGVSEIAVSDNGAMSGLRYAPDSAWLAWSQPGPGPLRRIRVVNLLAATDGRQVADVTDGRFIDTDPAFTADGRHLAFLSWRGFDPVYDTHTFDLSFPYGCRPYLVPLAGTTSSPFAPSPEGREPSGNDADLEPGDDGDGDGDDEWGGRVVVDLEGIAARVVPFPVVESRYSALAAVKNGVVWLREQLAGTLGEGGADLQDIRPRPILERFDLVKRKYDELVEELDWFDVSGDGGRVVVADDSRMYVVPAVRKGGGDDDETDIDLSRVQVDIDPVARWAQAYEEVGRILRHDFWVADLADVDLAAVLEEYRPLLDRVGGTDDFADLVGEVMGELGASHAYVRPAGGDAGDGPGVGLLGADLARDRDGVWRVTRVLPAESSDVRARSPLAGPGAGVRPGDAVLRVHGQPVDPLRGPAPLLVGSADKPVELTVGPAEGGPTRRVVVVPLGDDERLRYQAWVAERRAWVRTAGAGRLGYLHVPDMTGAGWAQLHRDLRVEVAHDGLVVDLRGNRGGHVSQLIVEKLARRVIGWDVPRGKLASTYPFDAPRGAVVALADEYAGSDGDIITAAIRALGLGPIVGTRTWGGVIGIDGWHRLADGTRITVPRYGTWLDGFGWEIENHGVAPDVEVVNSPRDWAAGRDLQLETAVGLALEALDRRPALRPPDPASRASRRRPPLPPVDRGG